MSIEIGASAASTTLITDDMVRVFASISGDNNPVHLDSSYALKTQFGRRIAHGMLVASTISAVIANKLPGPGAIYLSQSLVFNSPVFINDIIESVVTVQSIPKPGRLILLTQCFNQDKVIVLDGSALVKIT